MRRATDNWTLALLVLGVFCAALSVPAAASPAVTFESAGAVDNRDCAKAETSVGDLLTDAVRESLHTDVALLASSELKPMESPIPAGKISSGAIEDLISYPSDPLAVLELTGAALRKAIERSVGAYPQPNVAFLQVSGLEFSFEPDKPQGERLVLLKVNGKNVEDDSRFRVAVTNSLAGGANGYWRVWSAKDVKERLPHTTLIKALETYLKANPRVDYRKLGRIRLAN